MQYTRHLALAGALVLCWGAAVSAEPPSATQQERINQALRYWLELIDADQFYLVLDRQHREIRLAHGNAVLRNCPLAAAALPDQMADRQKVTGHLRRYRPSDPWSRPQIGRFDWEQNLVADAPPTAALYFSGGLLLYADDIWQDTRPPAVRLPPADLRALYNGLASGTPLVVLPEYWNGVKP